MSDLGDDRPRARPVAVAALLVLLALLAGAPGAAATAPVVAASPASSGPSCSGAAVASSYHGSFSVLGGPLTPSSLVGAGIGYHYDLGVTVYNRSTGAILSQQCHVENGTAFTNATDGFSFAASVPSSPCPARGPGAICTIYAGPYGPVWATPDGAVPVGYELEDGLSGTAFSIAYVAELASVTVTPANTTRVVSVGAPVPLTATARTGAGGVSPLPIAWNWSLVGPGWSVVTGGASSSVVVRAAVGAGNGTLDATATALVDGVPWSATGPTVRLSAVPTGLASGGFLLPVADLGSSAEVDVDGSGAAGWNYTGSVAPGLGAPTAPLACSASPGAAGTVVLACSAHVEYTALGIATPVATLTNGFSSASLSLPSETVVLPTGVSATPGAPLGYVGSPVSVTIVAAAGTGARPFERACFDGGDGPVECSSGLGPDWTFRATYPSVGNFSGDAWVIDHDGVNRSVEVPVRVAASLALATPTAASTPTVGVPLALTTSLSGGFFPARIWWNSSALASPIASWVLGSDGPVSVTFLPPALGVEAVRVTVVDALGTALTSDLTLVVAPGAVAAIAPPSPVSPGPDLVGTPIALAWAALGPTGAAVPDFAPASRVEIVRPDGSPVPAWVNVSGLGTLAPSASGGFTLPVAAWVGGEVRLTATAATAGPIVVRIVGAALPIAAAPVTALVVPDLEHLVLSDPIVHDPGARSNSTWWRVQDRYGDATVGGYLAVAWTGPDTGRTEIVPVEAAGAGSSGAWVNYSAPGPGGGIVRVYDPSGALRLGPIAVPALPATSPPDPALIALGAAVPLGAGVAVVAFARRRARSVDEATTTEAGESEAALERLAAGRATVVEQVRRSGPIDLAALEAGWEPAPAPPDLADWVASLVADGTLGAIVGKDRVARFTIAAPPVGPPRVEVDVDAFDRALASREELFGSESPGEDGAGDDG